MTTTTPDPAPADVAGDPSGDQRAASWVRVGRGAAIGVVLWAVVLQVLIGEFVVALTVIGVVFAGFVPFLRGARRRLALALGIVSLVALVAFFPSTVDDLSHPSSAGAFLPSLWVTLAGSTAVLAGAGAFFRWSARVRPVLATVGGIFALGVVAAGVATFGVESDDPLDTDVQVIAHVNEYEPTEIVVEDGSNGFWLDNQDGVRHTLSLEGTDFEIDVPGYSSKRADLDLAPGAYTFVCTVPGHENMKIDLTVES